MLRPARPQDAAFISALWTSEANSIYLDPPGPGVIEAATADGDLMVWDIDGAPAGFAMLTEWLPRVWGLREFAVDRRGQGRPFLEALLVHLFRGRNAHRIGLDCTADNARAIAFFTRAGFRHEGIWREVWQRPAGDWVDCIFYGLLSRDWQG